MKKQGLILASVALFMGILVAVLAMTTNQEKNKTFPFQRDPDKFIQAETLAHWIIMSNADFQVIDMRSQAEFKAGHVKGAVHCGSCHADKASGRKFMQANPQVDLSKKLVIYTQHGNKKIELPQIMKSNLSIYELAGGYERWHKEILEDVAFSDKDSESVFLAKKKKAAVQAFFTGKSVQPTKIDFKPVPMSSPHKSGGLKAEGC